MLILYEIKKILCIKYIIIIFIILLAVNMIVCCAGSEHNDSIIPEKYMNNLFEQYAKSKEDVNDEYRRITDQYNEQINLIMPSNAKGNTEFEINFSHYYIDYKNFCDYDLFTQFYSYVKYPEYFKDKINDIINTAKLSKENIEHSTESLDSYSYKYQLQLINKYSKILDNINIDITYTKGWNRYLQYDGVNIFIMLLMVVLGSTTFIYEKTTGFVTVMRASKRGRFHTAFAKIIASGILAIISVFCFALSIMFTIWFMYGYTDASVCIQSFSEYYACPYLWSVLEYVIVNILLKIAASLVVLYVTMLVSLIYRYSITFGAGLTFLVVNYIIYVVPSSNSYKYLNLFSAASANDILSRYRALPMFGISADILVLIPFIFAVFIAVSILMVICNDHNHAVNSLIKNIIYKKIKYPNALIRNVKRTKCVRMSLISGEVYKIRYILPIILVIIVPKCIYSNYCYKTLKSSSDQIYAEYMKILDGEITAEKLDYIKSEKTKIAEVLSAENDMRVSYNTGNITYEEYSTFLRDYYYCVARSEVIASVSSHAEYLINLQSQRGGTPCFFYDTGTKLLLERDFDPFLLFVVIILCCGSFVPEYAEKSSQQPICNVVRVTKCGRKEFYYVKILLYAGLSSILYFILNIIDILIISHNYSISALSAPLVSIEAYENAPVSMTILTYFLLIFFLGAVGIFIIAVFSITLSQLLRKPLYIYTLTTVVLLCPYALTKLGYKKFLFLDPTSLIAVDKLYRLSINTAFITEYAVLLLVMITAMSLMAFLLIGSHKSYCK